MAWTLLCRWTPNPLHRWRSLVIKVFGGKLGKHNFIYPSSKIWAPWLLETEDLVTIGPGVEIYNPGGVFLGHHAILSQDSYLCGATHDYDSIRFTYIKKEIIIDSYVWICAKATVLPGVRCAAGSVLGATSITSRNLDSWSVYAGNPCKFVKKRKNFLIQESELVHGS
ncbi:putative colanic acid biosynthesis acetyltransferase [Flavihumibacter sp. R14]|nr:putative colanic acid biosynthesis acetyltransferase [Flavihumibacter soli]